MKISILEKSDKEVYIEMDVTDMTLLHPLVEELVKELDKPVLHVRMKSGKPETAIKKATKTIVENFSDLKAGFEKEL
jgi:DNA-directed RNA polymerase subunit L